MSFYKVTILGCLLLVGRRETSSLMNVRDRRKLNITFRLTNSGISLSVGDDSTSRLAPVAGTPQDKPRRYYIYAHAASDGKYFYIGKGTGNRAWSANRHDLWQRYVTKHLNGKYNIVILQDNLSADEADELESEWIAQESDSLVNWINFGRRYDQVALDNFHKLRDANRALIAQAKSMEKVNLENAMSMYMKAISAIDEYAGINYESGLVGQLLKEEKEELGLSGEIEALDRLSLCLIKLCRPAEADSWMRKYFKKYASDLQRPVSDRIRKRVEKAMSKKAR